MPHLHFDCFSGISGDMCLGALVDAGVPLTALKKGLQQLATGGYQLKAKKVHRGTVHATKIDVIIREGFKKPLSLPTIRRILSQSSLPPQVKHRSREVFQRLAEAEGTVHGLPQAKVHFHEVGVIDSLVDIVGTLLGLYSLDITSISASSINVGSGTIHTAHGILPVPGPAVAQLALGIPIFASGPALELTTPTGMALLTALTQDFRALPPMNPRCIGYGAGTAAPSDWANVLRVFLCADSPQELQDTESILEIQTTIDDLNPQTYEFVMDKLFKVGALDVTLTPVIMKRSRPGIIVTVLSPKNIREDVIQTLFQETTTLGMRMNQVSRFVLPRRMETIQLREGTVQIKIADLGNGQQKAMPEYRDCQRLAMKTGKPVREIIDQAFQTFHKTKQAKKTARRTSRST
ncbi:MAG: TIGR00299 family protein [Nitrospirales bacterium]|nr:MAG: TIGR00299 family protein [Nitrospirales bacterium]